MAECAGAHLLGDVGGGAASARLRLGQQVLLTTSGSRALGEDVSPEKRNLGLRSRPGGSRIRVGPGAGGGRASTDTRAHGGRKARTRWLLGRSHPVRRWVLRDLSAVLSVSGEKRRGERGNEMCPSCVPAPGSVARFRGNDPTPQLSDAATHRGPATHSADDADAGRVRDRRPTQGTGPAPLSGRVPLAQEVGEEKPARPFRRRVWSRTADESGDSRSVMPSYGKPAAAGPATLRGERSQDRVGKKTNTPGRSLS